VLRLWRTSLLGQAIRLLVVPEVFGVSVRFAGIFTEGRPMWPRTPMVQAGLDVAVPEGPVFGQAPFASMFLHSVVGQRLQG
jgi:hypothetical protein